MPSQQDGYTVVATPTTGAALVSLEPSPPHMTPGAYVASRLPTLKPPMTKVASPIALLKSLDRYQWLNFAVGFAAWTWDAFDFFTVSMTLSDLAKTFGKSNTDITWGISVTLMLRPIGSIIFGLAADRYGRKWPFVVNNILFIVLELGTGFCNDFVSFMVVRAMYGVAMGGMWGMAAATALEDTPAAARGFMSGILQQGYSFGYLLAVVAARVFVNTTSHGWRPLFWFGACPPVLIIAFRMMLPETKAFRARQQARGSAPTTSSFISDGKAVFKQQWLLLIYLVMLMSAMNFLSHGSQDLYPTMLSNTLQFTPNEVTVTQVVANLGAITGSIVVGYWSQTLGRRLSILLCAVGAAAVLYPYCFTTDHGITAAAFFMQFCVMGAWGVIPIHLMELSPPAYATFVSGTAYQIGNLISATAATIEASLSEVYPLPPSPSGDHRFDYAKVTAALLAVVIASLAFLIIIGPEARGKEFADHADDKENQAI